MYNLLIAREAKKAMEELTKMEKQPKMVLVRTYSAGVHFGGLVSRSGKEVELAMARRIWSWTGANTLSEISLRGCSGGSKISEPVGRIVLTEAIEIIDMTPEAVSVMEKLGWGD